MNKRNTNLPKAKKELFQRSKKNPRNFPFKNPSTSQRTRSLGGHR